MVSVVRQVGRLVEVRCQAPLTAEDLASLMASIRGLLDQSSERALTAVDLRHLGLLDPVLVDKVVAFLRTENPRVERSVFLMAEGAAAMQTMQLERMLKQGGSPGRRLFKATADAEAWLGELLTPAEKSRLHLFFAAA
jgi:hypothetical protein